MSIRHLLAYYVLFAIVLVIVRMKVKVFGQEPEPVWLARLNAGLICLVLPAVLLALPALLALGLLLYVAAIPYQWLYPERSAWLFEEEAERELTEEEQRAVFEYRNALFRKSLFRRLGENLRLIERQDPPWPFSVDPEW